MGICCFAPLPQPDSFPHPDNIFRIDQATKETAIDVISRSFAGTPKTDPEGTLDWLLGPQLHGRWEDPRRMQMMKWFISLVYTMQIEKNGGFALAAKKEDGSMGAAIILKTADQGMSGSCTVAFRCLIPAICAVGKPPFKEMGDAGKGIEKRLNSLDIIEKMHKKHMSGPHIYVNVMAVDPICQGMGYCGRLMRFANEYADARKLPQYLETSGLRNKAIYEHFGYKAVEQFTCSCPKDGESEPHTDEFAMIRPAAA